VTGCKFCESALARLRVFEPVLIPLGNASLLLTYDTALFGFRNAFYKLSPQRGGARFSALDGYFTALAIIENVWSAPAPIIRTVATAIATITLSITAYSATSCPSSSRHNCSKIPMIQAPNDSQSTGGGLHRCYSKWSNIDGASGEEEFSRILQADPGSEVNVP
jgi:hypothetical protein